MFPITLDVGGLSSDRHSHIGVEVKIDSSHGLDSMNSNDIGLVGRVRNFLIPNFARRLDLVQREVWPDVFKPYPSWKMVAVSVIVSIDAHVGKRNPQKQNTNTKNEGTEHNLCTHK